MKKDKNPKGFPQTIKRGSAVVKIYDTPTRGRDGYTISYWVNGERKRQAFTEHGEAKLEAERIATRLATGEVDLAKLSSADWACYVRAKQLADSVNLPLESLAAQFVEATRALGSIPLKLAVEYYLKKYPKDLKPHLISEVMAEMLEAKRQDGLNPKYILHLRYDLEKFATAFNCTIATVTGAEIDAWLRSLGVAARTRNNLRTSVQTLFSYAKRKKYLPKDHDEMEAVPLVKGKVSTIGIFTPFEMQSLLELANERLVPFLVLGAFAGVRHAEIQRLTWEDIRLEENLIEISAENAKTASRRTIPISDNLKAWLLPHTKPSGPVCVYKNVADEINDLVCDVNTQWKAQHLGRELSWKRNGLRHSFISYRVAEIKNVAQVALEAGNSPQIIFSNYRELVRPADAKKWFSMVPNGAEKIIQLPAAVEGETQSEAVATLRL